MSETNSEGREGDSRMRKEGREKETVRVEGRGTE